MWRSSASLCISKNNMFPPAATKYRKDEHENNRIRHGMEDSDRSHLHNERGAAHDEKLHRDQHGDLNSLILATYLQVQEKSR